MTRHVVDRAAGAASASTPTLTPGGTANLTQADPRARVGSAGAPVLLLEDVSGADQA
jgi:hypothetical protein